MHAEGKTAYTCIKFNLWICFDIVCITWTAISTLVKKKKSEAHRQLLKEFKNTKHENHGNKKAACSEIQPSCYSPQAAGRAFLHAPIYSQPSGSLHQFNHFKLETDRHFGNRCAAQALDHISASYCSQTSAKVSVSLLQAKGMNSGTKHRGSVNLAGNSQQLLSRQNNRGVNELWLMGQ